LADGGCSLAPGHIEELPKAAQVLADTAYDSDEFREFLIAMGSTPVIKPNQPARTFHHSTSSPIRAAT